MNSTYQVKKVRDNVYQIMESGLCAMYFVCGSKRSVLIDTGVGTGDLKGVVERLTDTAVDVYLTHGHRDHFGGATQFSDIFISPRDMELTKAIDVESRKEYVAKMIEAKAADEEKLKYMEILDWGNRPRLIPVTHGQHIDLGDRNLTCIEVPGHTDGCVMYYDEGNNIIFSGDGANPIMVLRKRSNVDYKTYVRNWISNVKEINQQINDDTCICGGHDMIEREVWHHLIEMAESYVDGALLPERRKIHFYEADFLVNGNVSIMLG